MARKSFGNARLVVCSMGLGFVTAHALFGSGDPAPAYTKRKVTLYDCGFVVREWVTFHEPDAGAASVTLKDVAGNEIVVYGTVVVEEAR